MSLNEKEFEKRMLDALESANYLTYNFSREIFGDLTKEEINKLSTSCMQVEVFDDGIKFINEDGDTIICPDYEVSISNDGEWLSNYLPVPSFDLDQAGNLRKANEAESAYCAIMVTAVLKDEVFKNELENVVKNYDFEAMKATNGENDFSTLLKEWLDLQSRAINVIVSAAKYRIADRKKDTEKYLRDGIPEDLAIELRSLDILISDINRRYSNGKLSPMNVKKLTKIEILELLDSKKNEIDGVIRNSRVETLYRALNLSTEYISPITKKKLRNLATIEVEKLFNEGVFLTSLIGDKDEVIKRWKKRYLRIARANIRKENVIKYLELGQEYKLPVKV
jgi:hypothetical protein